MPHLVVVLLTAENLVDLDMVDNGEIVPEVQVVLTPAGAGAVVRTT
jgi:hypothetical protein